MELSEEDKITSDEAIVFIRRNIRTIYNVFANLSEHPRQNKPGSIFLAGSPGAGKTEFSTNFIGNPVRIDADAVRDLIPQYRDGKCKSYVVQGACGLAVDKLYDYALDQKLHCILDATFADPKKSIQNVERSVRRGRPVEIFYIYQDPLLAWEYTKIRERKERGEVPEEVFINSFVSARENANKVKAAFGKEIKLNFIHRNYTDSTLDQEFMDIDNIDTYLNKRYNKEDLERIIL